MSSGSGVDVAVGTGSSIAALVLVGTNPSVDVSVTTGEGWQPAISMIEEIKNILIRKRKPENFSGFRMFIKIFINCQINFLAFHCSYSQTTDNLILQSIINDHNWDGTDQSTSGENTPTLIKLSTGEDL